MKKFRYILFCLPALLCVACDSNIIDEYELGAKLNFYSYRTVNNVPEMLCHFSDEDYVNGVTEKLDSVRVDIMDVAEEKDRPSYCTTDFQENEPHVEVLLEDQYVMPAGQYAVNIRFKVCPPSVFGVRHRTNIRFDEVKNAVNFTPGLTERQTCIVSCTYLIRPDVWHDPFWGAYSNGKYKFMMDEFKAVYGNIKRNNVNKTFIKAQYEEYRKTNPPIMDDQIPAQEIKF